MTSLEVSSLLVASISGRKFPGISRAFLETISAWAYQFDQMTIQLGIEAGPRNKNNRIVYAVKKWHKQKKNLFDKIAETASVQEEDDMFPELANDEGVKNLLKTEDMNRWRREVFCKPPINEIRNRELGPTAFRLLRIQDRLDRLRRRIRLFYKNRAAPYRIQEQQSENGTRGFWSYLKSVFRARNRISGRSANLPAHYVMELRKLWELKDGFIFAQHTIQLDGDVINRYNENLYCQNIDKLKIPELLEYHNTSVDIGLKQWQYLIKTIAQMARAVGEKLVSAF